MRTYLLIADDYAAGLYKKIAEISDLDVVLGAEVIYNKILYVVTRIVYDLNELEKEIFLEEKPSNSFIIKPINK